MSSAHQLIDADEGACRVFAVKVRAIDGVEFVVEIQISAIDSHRDEVVGFQSCLFKSVRYRIHHQARLVFNIGCGLTGGRVDPNVSRNIKSLARHDSVAEGRSGA